MTLGLPVGAVMNCADNSGAKSEFAKARAREAIHATFGPAASYTVLKTMGSYSVLTR